MPKNLHNSLKFRNFNVIKVFFDMIKYQKEKPTQ